MYTEIVKCIQLYKFINNSNIICLSRKMSFKFYFRNNSKSINYCFYINNYMDRHVVIECNFHFLKGKRGFYKLIIEKGGKGFEYGCFIFK